ncbi:MAG: ornithine cyclodeaminase family protein [Dehalococcoidia bacterium]|nr:ornithine cyclodeaminase family protein [Dehalococcoidia bacterium]
MPTDALLLTEADLLPLTREAAVIDGAIAALEAATKALHTGGVTQSTFMGRAMANGRPSARLTLATGAGLHTGVRIQGNGPAANNRSYVLADGETGGVLSVMNFGTINPIRVGASGGLAAKYLAPPRTHTLAVIGSGQQARTQAQAIVRAMPGLQGAFVYSPNVQHRAAFAEAMTGWLGVPFRHVDSIDEAVGDAGVVALANSAREVLLRPEQLQQGTLVIDVSEGQLAPEFVTQARSVFITWEGVANNPIPREPYSTPIKAGAFTREHLGAELTAVVAAGANPRRTADDIVVYVLTAANVHDLAMAQWAYEWARAAGAGTPFVLTL